MIAVSIYTNYVVLHLITQQNGFLSFPNVFNFAQTLGTNSQAPTPTPSPTISPFPPQPPPLIPYQHPKFMVFAYPGVATPNGSSRTGPDVFHGVFERTTPLGLPPTEGWAFGDRIGYGCAYWYWMANGQVAARFTLQKVPAASYIVINDKYGPEYKPQSGCPLPKPTNYNESVKPTDLLDSHVLLNDPSGEEVARVDLPATGTLNPDSWWEIENSAVTPNKVVAEGYLGTHIVLILTVELNPGSPLGPLKVKWGP